MALSSPGLDVSRKRDIPFAGIDCSFTRKVPLPCFSDGDLDLAGGVMLAETVEV